MKRKQYLSIILAAILLLTATAGFAGCKNDAAQTDGSETTLAAENAQTQAEKTLADDTKEETLEATQAAETAREQTEASSAGTTAAGGNSSASASSDTANTSTGTNPVPTQRTGNGVNPITGISGYDSSYYAHKKVVGVVVENHPGARPQWGMSTPDVTFEYEVEGGISRMLWLYANMDELPAKVGPVRSLRHDIAELARGYDLFLVHCGGSGFAYNKVKEYNGALTTIDGNSFDGCFTRDTTRDVAYEHKLILLGDAFRTAVVDRNLNMTANGTHQNFFHFASEQNSFKAGDSKCGSVHFEYSGDYTYTFKYNASTGLFDANINGSPRVDDQGVQCAYKNLVLLYVEMEDMNTTAKHQDLLLEKGGKGIYAANGGWTEITWQKGTDVDMLKLYDLNGSELTLNAGKSYIGFVRSTRSGKTVIS